MTKAQPVVSVSEDRSEDRLRVIEEMLAEQQILLEGLSERIDDFIYNITTALEERGTRYGGDLDS